MNEYIEIIKNNNLFENISKENIISSLKCLNATIKKYNINTTIYGYGDRIKDIGIIISGSILITKEDADGNRLIVSTLKSLDLFGETFAFSSSQKSTVNIISKENTIILFLDFSKILTTCSNNCSHHTLLIQNMIKIIANKNLNLNNKIDILSAKTTREKIMTYLKFEMKRSNSYKFKIDLNRENLAEFLSINRSNMCRELSKMKKDNIINYSKNSFEIIKKP